MKGISLTSAQTLWCVRGGSHRSYSCSARKFNFSKTHTQGMKFMKDFIHYEIKLMKKIPIMLSVAKSS
jgi:hypothetical protein